MVPVARHFCFCLPLRLGAFLISLCQLVLVGLSAAGGWYTLDSMRGRLPTHLKGIIITSALYYTLFSIAAFIGLFGTITRKANLLATYAFYLAWSTIAQIVIDVVHLILFFGQSREKLIQNCIDGSTDPDVQNICNNSFNVSRTTIIISMIIGLTIQIWAAYIVASYAEKLQNEKSWQFGSRVVPLGDTSGPKYPHVTVQQQDDHDADASLTNAPYAYYPYNDTNNSFKDSTSHYHSTTAV